MIFLLDYFEKAHNSAPVQRSKVSNYGCGRYNKNDGCDAGVACIKGRLTVEVIFMHNFAKTYQNTRFNFIITFEGV